MEVVRAIEKVGSQGGTCSQKVVIADCGQLSWCDSQLQSVASSCFARALHLTHAFIPAECDRHAASAPCCGGCTLRTRMAVTTCRACVNTAEREAVFHPYQLTALFVSATVSTLEAGQSTLVHARFFSPYRHQ